MVTTEIIPKSVGRSVFRPSTTAPLSSVLPLLMLALALLFQILVLPLWK